MKLHIFVYLSPLKIKNRFTILTYVFLYLDKSLIFYKVLFKLTRDSKYIGLLKRTKL